MGRTVRAPWAALAGVAAGLAFVVAERREREPMLPLGLFCSRTFSAANVMTLLVYAALGAILFFLVLQLQTVGGYGALAAGLATLPITVCMLFLAAKGGELGTRIGPRIPMTFGPMVMAVGVLLLLGVDEDVNYWLDVLPGLTIFGLGLALMVAPLTATVLAAAPDEHAGIASGVNNAVARAGFAAGGRRAAGRGRTDGRGVRRPAGLRLGVRHGDADLRRAARRRRRGLVVHDPPDRAGVRRRRALPLCSPLGWLGCT